MKEPYDAYFLYGTKDYFDKGWAMGTLVETLGSIISFALAFLLPSLSKTKQAKRKQDNPVLGWLFRF